jgi:hypothetical protein
VTLEEVMKVCYAGRDEELDKVDNIMIDIQELMVLLFIVEDPRPDIDQYDKGLTRNFLNVLHEGLIL